MPTLHLLLDGQDLPHSVQADETVLGRHPECQLQINSNMVSRKHARVVKEGTRYLLEDLGSGNGTFLNGKKIEGPAEIRHDDRIKLGPILLRFEAMELGGRTTPLSGPNVATQTLNLDGEGDDDDDTSTITGQSVPSTGFGRLEVQPQAKLKAVLEISRSLAGTTDLNALLPKILDTLFKVFPHADRGCVLFKTDDGKMIPKATKHRRATEDETVKVSRTILRKVMTEKTGVLSADATNDARFEASESISNLTIRSMMCVPLLSLEGEPIGVISIDTQNPFNQFKEEDLDLLVAVAGQAAMSYESARLVVTEMDKKKQDFEIGIAKGVQLALLPTELPKPNHWEFFASYDSAQAVGGDYFDCMFLPDRKHVCFAFGDVAGKGVPAALIMSKLSTIVTITMNFVSNVQEAANRINDQMCTKAVEGRFATFIIGIIDPTSGDLEFVNCGHMPLMIRKVDGSIEEVGEEAIGVPLGVMEAYPYEAVKRRLEPGETVVLYTDGVSEAMNPNSDLYGMDRLRELVHTSQAGKAEDLGKTILADVRKFANGRPQNDDITIMVIGRGT